MECPQCKTTSPEGKKYCGDCGAILGPEVSARESELRPLIEAFFAERVKEQKVVEIEVAQAIAARLVDWAKLLGVFVAIPLGLLAIILGVLGFSDYRNFNDHINKSINNFDNRVADIQKSLDSKVLVATQSTTASMEQARNLSSLAREESVRLTSEVQRLRDLVETNSQKVASLATKVERIEQFGFEGFSASTGELRQKLESTLASFQDHLSSLGYKPKAGKITVSITNDIEYNAFYSSSDNKIVLARNIADDLGIALHTYAVYVLTSTHNDKPVNYTPLLSGIADYLACSFLDDSRLGRQFFKSKDSPTGKSYLRELNNALTFKNMDNIEPHVGGEIWGGAFWEIRQRIGQHAADKLIFSTWVGMQAGDGRSLEDSEFVTKLLESDQKLEGGQHLKQIRAVFESRGLKLKS